MPRRQPFYHRRRRAKAALHNRPRECQGGKPPSQCEGGIPQPPLRMRGRQRGRNPTIALASARAVTLRPPPSQHPRQCDGGNPATTAVALRWRNPTAGNSLPPTRTNWPAFPLIVYVILCVKRCVYEESREKQKTSTKTLTCSHGFHVSVTVSREVRHARSRERTCANMRDDKTATREAEGGMRWIYSVEQTINDLR
jgi:hypothetical protein